MNQKDVIKNYVALLNDETIASELLDFIVDVTIERICIYINCDTIPMSLNRIIAQIVAKSIKSHKDEMSGNETFVSSISDNGQSISYSNEIKKYFANASDNEIFNGFESLLARYRRVNVVNFE